MNPRAIGLIAGASQFPLLFARAARLTRRRFGDAVEFCAIINAKSGRCSEDCAFCAQSSRHRTAAPEHGLLPPERVAAAARQARSAGVRRFSIVTSGKAAPRRELDDLARLVETVAEAGLTPCASLGCLDEPALRRLRSAGLDRFHHNLETASSHYPEICRSHAWSERVETIRAAQAAGLSVCSGGIFGLGETPAQRLEFLRELRDLSVDSVAVNFLSPIPGTPLAGRPTLSPWEALSALAVTRLVVPDREIRTCGGRVQTLGPLSAWQYLAGANATMTGDYLTTSGPRPERDREEIALVGLRPPEIN